MTSRRTVLIGGGSILTATALAGCSALESDGDGEFAFEQVVFTDGEQNGDGEYDERADATYARGEEVWLHVEVGYPPLDGDDTAVLEYTFDVEAPDGDRWEPVTRTETWDDVGDEVLIVGQSFATYEDDAAGEYELTITVEDQVDGERLTRTETFTLE